MKVQNIAKSALTADKYQWSARRKVMELWDISCSNVLIAERLAGTKEEAEEFAKILLGEKANFDVLPHTTMIDTISLGLLLDDFR